MTIHAYKFTNPEKHWVPAAEFTSLGFNAVTSKHYFHIPEGVAIPDQPAEIEFGPVTDAEELKQVAAYCPAFFGNVEAMKQLTGIE